jgi:hypothetical protein
LQCGVSDSAIAKRAATHAGSRHRNGRSGETGRPQRTCDSAAAAPGANDGPVGKSCTPAAAPEAHSTDSDVPTEPAAYAATTTSTGICCVDQQRNGEEQCRSGDDAPADRFQCCCSQHRERLALFMQIESVRR